MKSQLPDFVRNVVQSTGRTREQAAWEFLRAARELFPERFEELRSLGERLVCETNDELAEEDPHNREAVDRFLHAVRDWTASNSISCPAVDDAAATWAIGDTPSSGVYLRGQLNEKGDLVDETPSLKAYPFNETRQEFLKKASQYYDECVLFCHERGNKVGPVKRNPDPDRYLHHFRYLAAHLIGKHSWAEIAREPARFKVDAENEKTVAGEARKVAHLIGLPLRAVPGPRPGSRLHPAATRVRR